jgi:hypothetical protein
VITVRSWHVGGGVEAGGAPEPIAPVPANMAVYAEAYPRYRALFDHIEEALA